MSQTISVRIAMLLGLLAMVNGTFMILAPEPWYWLVPGVSDRGPFNQHFLRDIGINYLLIGAAFVLGCVYERQRLALWLFPAAWLLGHALFHIWEVFVGLCSPIFLVIDFVGVTLPALLSVYLIYVSYTLHR
ncbi:hypothetical protein [Pseudoalteromonas byunsanensis]|uniref:Uncharacterized protein n=1 Tax=Pseudoalteromonas byunsanensis TaxID=327939 RepID=A0A1S1N9N2_9GAMM|nr:hypothetical protein [Pseudoalteromonas byunsanensis]OHU94980.1 hypothetical protein BIW53_13265 [Pseudoalteromonas byunsanensis]